MLNISSQILLLDDNHNHLTQISDFLSNNPSLEIVSFSESLSALQALENKVYNFSAFILDIEMTGQEYSGIDVAERIRELPGNALKPIIFLTSYAHFSFGALKHIHYYDFFHKPCKPEALSNSLKRALSANDFANQKQQVLTIHLNHFEIEVDIKSVSCMELFSNVLVVTDLLGNEQRYKVKPNTFTDICNQLTAFRSTYLQQVHRSVIVNLNRIKKIEWQKNTAMIWLFNVHDWKPVGKTFLKKLDAYRE